MVHQLYSLLLHTKPCQNLKQKAFIIVMDQLGTPDDGVRAWLFLAEPTLASAVSGRCEWGLACSGHIQVVIGYLPVSWNRLA